MGALASLFAGEKKNKVDIFLDFESASRSALAHRTRARGVF